MLSCRFSGPGTDPYNRRLASADRILQLVSQEQYGDLPPLPLVPYAVSMSTTMIYRALGNGQRDLTSACDDLKVCCTALRSLSKTWTGVRGVSKMASKLWKVLSASDAVAMNRASTSSAGPPPALSPAVESSGNGMRRSSTNTTSQQNSYDDKSSVTSVYPESNTTLASPPQSSDQTQQPQYGVPRTWAGFDPSFFQLDTAFNDLFDGGLPNFFRPHTAWEFLHALNGESPQEFEVPYPQCVESFDYEQQNQGCS